jgi:hypothetical protein
VGSFGRFRRRSRGELIIPIRRIQENPARAAMTARSNWIDDLDGAHTPTSIARRLLAVPYEVLTRDELPDVGLRRIAILARALATLMLDPQDLPRKGKVLADSDWMGFGGASLWPAYEPSVIAGTLTLSRALRAALAEGVEATTLLLATSALDALPRVEQIVNHTEDQDIESIIAGYRIYKLVPPVCDMRLTWITLAMMRERDPDDGRARERLNKGWLRLARVRTDTIETDELLRGLVLKQVVESLVEVLARGSRARAPLDFSDLPELAACAPAALARHGTRGRVAHAFQARLTAVLRSFNGLVVPARPGEALPDIYCELPDGDFVLVDAKSCAGRGYTLPSSDADALGRYVRDAPRLLPKGRAVRALLIVGPAASATLAARLVKLEDAVERPVRFATAAQLASLRDQHPGGPLEGLLDALRHGSHVLPDGWWRPIVEWAHGENERLEEYVRKGLRR